MKISKNINKNIKLLNERYGTDKSFDVISRKILIGGKLSYILMIDGFAKDSIMLHVIQRLQTLSLKEINTKNISTFVKRNIAYIEVEVIDDFNTIEELFLSGAAIILIDGEDSVVMVDAREYPVRSVAEPELEKVTRGPRDGFVETLIFNTILLRRRIKDEHLRFELKTVGQKSKTNLSITYLENLVDKKLLREITKKIDQIKVSALVMAEKTLAEILIPNKWYNPLPKVRFTERPDVAAAHLLEGHILIMVDTTPSVIIIPSTIFHFTQHAEDYYQVPLVGTYIRQIRFLSLFLSLLLGPVWYLISQNPQILPKYLQIIGPGESTHLPVIIQLLILELSLDLLKISSIHTPNSLSTSLGIVGGLILGNFAVEAGLFTPEVILVMAITAIASFATPSIEFSNGIRIFRLFLLIMCAFLKLPGLIIGLIIISVIIFTTDNGANIKYTYPLYPFNPKALKHILFRLPIPKIKDK